MDAKLPFRIVVLVGSSTESVTYYKTRKEAQDARAGIVAGVRERFPAPLYTIQHSLEQWYYRDQRWF